MLESECVSKWGSKRAARCLSRSAHYPFSTCIDLLELIDAEEVYTETRAYRTEFGIFTLILLNKFSEKPVHFYIGSFWLVFAIFSTFQEDTFVTRIYSRTSVARTLMARLPRLFRTRSRVPKKNSFVCRFWIILCDFLFYIENGMLYVLIRIASMRRF